MPGLVLEDLELEERKGPVHSITLRQWEGEEIDTTLSLKVNDTYLQ